MHVETIGLMSLYHMSTYRHTLITERLHALITRFWRFIVKANSQHRLLGSCSNRARRIPNRLSPVWGATGHSLVLANRVSVFRQLWVIWRLFKGHVKWIWACPRPR